MTGLTLADVDRDDALSEGLAGLYGTTRAGFLRASALGGAAMLGSLLTPAPAAAELSDVGILRFGLRFEYLQAAFYTEAEQIGTIGRMTARKQQWARVLGAHERAHVRIIRQVLGPKAEASPFFDFRGASESDAAFTRTAVAMEDLTVALLSGVTPAVQDRRLTAALFSLLTVEARHASWARHIVGTTPAAQAFDDPRAVPDVASIIDDTHFIVKRPQTRRRRHSPRFTG